MYYPYFRGKQFELITIRETASTLAKSHFVPIIEPVRESLGGLGKALHSINEAGGNAIVVVNPYHGDHRENGDGISNFLCDKCSPGNNICAGILLKGDMGLEEVKQYYDIHVGHNPVFIHAGFVGARELATKLARDVPGAKNIFIENHAKILYRKHFESGMRVLVRDGFVRQRNADYPEVEEFSDLHVTFKEYGMEGFGDFLIVGDNYSETGGPAYAVAIHLTFIDPDNDDVMFIYHFVSDTRDTPSDPAGKFAQALGKLVRKLDSGRSKIYETEAVAEFRHLHSQGHFPGLGYVKKLSMRHHIETMSQYLVG